MVDAEVASLYNSIFLQQSDMALDGMHAIGMGKRIMNSQKRWMVILFSYYIHIYYLKLRWTNW